MNADKLLQGINISFKDRTTFISNLRSYNEEINIQMKDITETLIKKLDQSQRICLQQSEQIEELKLNLEQLENQNTLLDNKLREVEQQLQLFVSQIKSTIVNINKDYQIKMKKQSEFFQVQIDELQEKLKQYSGSNDYDKLLTKYGLLLNKYQQQSMSQL
ncbi:hypothetical protein pb186bvf_006836 [Paramecium bursaria]